MSVDDDSLKQARDRTGFEKKGEHFIAIVYRDSQQMIECPFCGEQHRAIEGHQQASCEEIPIEFEVGNGVLLNNKFGYIVISRNSPPGPLS